MFKNHCIEQRLPTLKCNVCGDSSTTVSDGICRACDMDWEWFMELRVVDLERDEHGMWRAPYRDGKMVVVAVSTEELRELIKRQPIGRDRGGSL